MRPDISPGARCSPGRDGDRDRGSSHLLSPPTPPDKRVRIRRFDELLPYRTGAGGSKNAPPMVVSPLVEFPCRLHPLLTRSSPARAYVSEQQHLYDYMTVEQMIRFTKSFYPAWHWEIEQKLLRTYELPLDRKVGTLSKGMRRKLALLLAFARKPELLILDEPSDSLDPIGIEQLLESMVAQCSEGTSIFFSSHQIAEVERVADDVCVIHKGRLAMNGSLNRHLIRTEAPPSPFVIPSVPACRGTEGICDRQRR